MFLPALEEKKKREEQQKENLLYLPDLREQYEEYIKNQKREEKEPERVITIQIM